MQPLCTGSAEAGGHLNRGIYLEEDIKTAAKTNFCMGIGRLPRKAFRIANLETDMSYLKAKVDAGPNTS